MPSLKPHGGQDLDGGESGDSLKRLSSRVWRAEQAQQPARTRSWGDYKAGGGVSPGFGAGGFEGPVGFPSSSTTNGASPAADNDSNVASGELPANTSTIFGADLGLRAANTNASRSDAHGLESTR
jgi:hypothetical protein